MAASDLELDAAGQRYDKGETPAHQEPNMLTAHDIYLFREGTHGRLYQRMGCHLVRNAGGGGSASGASFAVWAPNARAGLGRRRVQRVGIGSASDAGTRGRLRRVGALRSGRRTRADLQVPGGFRACRIRGRQGRSLRVFRGSRARDGLAGLGARPRLERRRVDENAHAPQCARCADVDLRAASWLVAARRR